VRCHNDDQDVFIMQVWGKKKWALYDADDVGKLLIYTEEMVGKKKPIDPNVLAKARVIAEPVLEPGDILYMPRGLVHVAKTFDNSPSLHFTLTVPSCDYCWGSLFENYLRGFSQVLQRSLKRALYTQAVKPQLKIQF
jgi:ribosomal protein L16 Arg81 hydroxylase